MFSSIIVNFGFFSVENVTAATWRHARCTTKFSLSPKVFFRTICCNWRGRNHFSSLKLHNQLFQPNTRPKQERNQKKHQFFKILIFNDPPPIDKDEKEENEMNELFKSAEMEAEDNQEDNNE